MNRSSQELQSQTGESFHPNEDEISTPSACFTTNGKLIREWKNIPFESMHHLMKIRSGDFPASHVSFQGETKHELNGVQTPVKDGVNG